MASDDKYSLAKLRLTLSSCWDAMQTCDGHEHNFVWGFDFKLRLKCSLRCVNSWLVWTLRIFAVMYGSLIRSYFPATMFIPRIVHAHFICHQRFNAALCPANRNSSRRLAVIHKLSLECSLPMYQIMMWLSCGLLHNSDRFFLGNANAPTRFFRIVDKQRSIVLSTRSNWNYHIRWVAKGIARGGLAATNRWRMRWYSCSIEAIMRHKGHSEMPRRSYGHLTGS